MNSARVRFLIIALVFIGGLPTGLKAEQEQVTETCGVCHEQETAEWQASPHARTIDEDFLRVWNQQGKKWECLVCHASRYDRQTGDYSPEGVTCESCHGALKENHPDEANMGLPVSSETCQPCHSVTYGEWRISAHGQKEIRCFDCHKMHQMQLRKDDPDQMCGTCHTERLQDFSHATHRVEGLHCTSCHMPETSSGLKIKGTGVRGHSFGVGAETCANCHREMVHASGEHAALQEEVTRLKAASPVALRDQVEELQQQNANLQAAVRANRRVFGALAVVTFALGLAVEYAILHRRRTRDEKGHAP